MIFLCQIFINNKTWEVRNSQDTSTKITLISFVFLLPPPPRRSLQEDVHCLYHVIAKGAAGSSTHLLHHVHSTGVGISWSWDISRWDSHNCRRSMCMERSCNRLLRGRRMIIMMMMTVEWHFRLDKISRRFSSNTELNCHHISFYIIELHFHRLNKSLIFFYLIYRNITVMTCLNIN